MGGRGNIEGKFNGGTEGVEGVEKESSRDRVLKYREYVVDKAAE
jgi:hypothetical protein